MAGSLKMACHRASHDSKTNEANIDHFALSFHGLTMRRSFGSCTIEGLRRWLSSACIRIAAGIIGELDMCDTSEMFLQRWRDVTFHHLHVVNVILNEEV